MADYKNFERILRNVDKLNSRAMLMKPEASASEIRQYLQGEGYTQDRFLKAAENYSKAQGLTAEYGLVKSGLQGLSFGFGDEFEASIKTLTNKKPYEQNLAAIQFAKQEFEAENPVAAVSTELAGSLPTAFAAGSGTVNVLSKIPSLVRAGQRIATPVKTAAGTTAGGTIFGGITGAGQAEEGKRLEGGKTGAQLGAFLSPVALYGGKALGSTLQKTAEVTGIQSGAQSVVEATKNIPIVKSITGKTAQFLGLSDDAVQRRADTKIIQALQQDKLTVDQVRQAMDTIRKSGYKPETIMEFGGDATKRLGEVVSLYPSGSSAAVKLVEERKAGQAERVLTDFQNAFRTNADALDLADNLIQTRAKMSQPLYQKAYEKDVVIGGESLDDFMKLPKFQEAYKKAQTLAEYDGIRLPSLTETNNVIDLKTADYIKRGLDDVLFVAKMPTSGIGKTELGKLKEKRAEFVKFIDDYEGVPVEYKQARQAYSGTTSIIDAIEEGKNFFNLDARELRKTFDSLTPAEKDAFAVGAYDAVKLKINSGADGADAVRRVFGSPEKRDQLRVLLGDESFAGLEANLARERAIRGVDLQLTSGSRTQPKAVSQAEFEGETDLVPQILNKGLMGGARDYLIRSTRGTGSITAEKLAPELFSIDPSVQARLFDRLGLTDEFLRQQAIRQSTASGVIGGTSAPSLLD
jgi:hypothetical protein